MSEVTEILNRLDVDIKKVEKGLKALGLSLSELQTVNEAELVYNVDLIKLVSEVDQVKSSRRLKLELRSQLDKVINKNDRVIQFNEKPIKSRSAAYEHSSEVESIVPSYQNLKLGEVKFFDVTKGFGFIHSLDDGKDCFVHISQVTAGPIAENDVVVFETKDSRKKPGELDAFNVSNEIPVYCFNKETASKSLAIPLLRNHLTKEYLLDEKTGIGFCFLKAKQRGSAWSSTVANYLVEERDISHFASEIGEIQLWKSIENKSSLSFLQEHFRSKNDLATLTRIYQKVLDEAETKPLPRLSIDLNDFEENEEPFFNYITAESNTLNKVNFVLWLQGKIPNLPLPETQEQWDFFLAQLLPHLDQGLILHTITKLLAQTGKSKIVKVAYEFLLASRIDINSTESLKIVISFLQDLKKHFPKVILTEENFQATETSFYIRLLSEGILSKPPDNILQQHLASLPSELDRIKFIDSLNPEIALGLYGQFPTLSNAFYAYIERLLSSTFKELDFICFDLESDGKEIREFAWETKTGARSHSDFKNVDKGINSLVQELGNAKIIVGQNIRGFDLPILKKQHGLQPVKNVWDTLEIEMLLTQQRFSYGLKTAHTASNDVRMTIRLFKNQLLRIASSEANLTLVGPFIPKEAEQFIEKLRAENIIKTVDPKIFDVGSAAFFRPNPLYNSLPEKTFNELKEHLNVQGNTVVVAPGFLWEPLSHHFNFNFFSRTDHGYSMYFVKAKVREWDTKNLLLKAIVERFVDGCALKGLKPYARNLPQSIRSMLSAENLTQLCKNDLAKFRISADVATCIMPEESECLKGCDQTTRIIVVGRELYNITSKFALTEDFDFLTLFDRLSNEPIWLQMSGGKSFIPLQREHCRLLGIVELPDYLQNIWLEKVGRGKFKVWCNIDFDGLLNDLAVHSICYLDWNSLIPNEKSNAFIARPDPKKSGYIADQKRVNPESLNRKLYWTYQFKLFEGTTKSKNPKILIVNDDTELSAIRSFARIKGYFIPDVRSSLTRQLEILHNSNSNSLLIAPFQDLANIIASNYAGALDIIWDSFLLQEKLQMIRGKAAVLNSAEQSGEREDYKESKSVETRQFDQFSLIAIHKPLIDYYYKLVEDNHEKSNLFLFDSRLTDFYGIEKSLELNAIHIPMWFRESEYKNDYELAGKFFSSKTDNTNPTFDINEAKEILRHIFLSPEDGGKPFEWHSYQHPCLDQILPAKEDLLISLPTGAGKSLLFQGPALFRSGFSCKLSIVISPLRALMQDQVNALWTKGFYSNVDYLSGDKSQVEIRDIYRRVAGGEITLLYITPERFRARAFENCLLTRLDSDNGLEFAVFDEAHCISQWGQEFRPDYLNAGRKIAGYSQNFNLRKLLFSATISEQVFQEISQLMPGITTVKGTEKTYNPVRNHIKMDFKHNVIEDERLREVGNYLISGSFKPELSRAIIFVKSRRKVEECALIMPDILREVFGANCSFADNVGGFHAGMDAEDRTDTYEKFKRGGISILFATKAFGMGMDIPNIHFVTHYSPPSTFEDFLQEIGRAGRNEKQRINAGFDTKENPIKTLCLTANNDFAKLKDQLHESRISWHEVKEIKGVIEDYISRFNKLVPNKEVPVAVPFNLYSTERGSANEDNDNKFRLALHWLERLERIKLGYFTITHLEFESKSLGKLPAQTVFTEKLAEQACKGIIEILPKLDLNQEVVQISIAELRASSKLSLENLFAGLLSAHKAGIISLKQEVVIEPTKLRSEEATYCYKDYYTAQKYPALRVIFSLARHILSFVPSNESKIFEGSELDDMINTSINECINFKKLPWSKKDLPETQEKEYKAYINDIIKKRSKHAFTILRSIGKIKHETKIEKIHDSNRKALVIQSVFNGYHKKDEWVLKLKNVESDAVKLLDFVARNFFEKNQKVYNWAEVITKLGITGNVQYLSDLLFILAILGYAKSGGLLPSGIEVYLTSVEPINEADLQSRDKTIHDEYDETRKVRELKLIALEVLSGFHKGSRETGLIRKKQDDFIRRYFGCSSLDSLLQLLQEELPPNDPLIVKWRGDAIKTEEDKLNKEQRKVYDADINQHISVMAGPGSGKTHTLTLRVAKLVHHIGIPPEEILVLAYNRAVVSELKERLGKLFNDLGYGNLSKRIKIFTFHGLAKKYCQEDVNDQPFDEWENILLSQLEKSPGKITNHLTPLKHILVDEFQDINNVRIKLLNRLHQLTGSYQFIIGDPNQSIYGYERIKEDGSLSPWPYYDNFNSIFKPANFNLFDNHRSYPEILKRAGDILILPKELQYLLPRPTRVPEKGFIKNYAEVIDRTINKIDWWPKVQSLIDETVGDNGRPYRQIAVLFRTNNEVYRGFQKIKSLNLKNIRIRIQGSLPYEFTRIRECHALLHYLKEQKGPIPRSFSTSIQTFANDLIAKHSNWNHFYIKLTHALVIEYQEEGDEAQTFELLVDFIKEITHRDDGQLYKIYEKHLERTSSGLYDTEIVLTTMHKVKGLEFDCVVIPPSFSNLPLKQNQEDEESDLIDSFDEERRLLFVAYTRARYRLVAFKHLREKALEINSKYQIATEGTRTLGIAVHPEIKKLKIGWAAKSFNFNGGVNRYISDEVRSGDHVFIKKRIVRDSGPC